MMVMASGSWGMTVPPLSSALNPAIRSCGQSERLNSVRFLLLLAARELSRNRLAGGEPRLGTASIYMGSIIAMAPAACNQNPPDYMATIPTLLNQFRRHINHLMVRKEGSSG